MRGKYSGLEVTEKSRQPRRSAPYVTTAPTRSARLLFFISRGGSCLFEAREMIYTSTECDKALKSFADKWASMVLDHIKMCDTADIRLLQKELKETKKPHR